MCGIFAVFNDGKNQAAQTVLQGLKKLEYRGYDSWGIALSPLKRSELQVQKHVGKIGQASTSLPAGKTAIGHTRWATHGGVTDTNAHPHLDCTKHIAVIHNGIVENYQELKSELIAKGHVFMSETDTEIIAHLVEENAKKIPLQKAVFKTFRSLVGSNAVCVIHSKDNVIVACRNGSPLVVGLGKNETYLASDTVAFLHKTNRVHYLEDNEGVVIDGSGTTLTDLTTGKNSKVKTVTLDWKAQDADKGGYPHYLLKEIMEQKITIPRAYSGNKEEIKKLADKIRKGYKIVLVGCGTASYCALAAHYRFAMNRLDSQALGGYEFEPFAGSISKDSMIFAISQSGETADTIIAVKEAKKRGAQIVAVVNARGSTLERIADSVLPVNAGPEIAVVSTKAFSAQLATLFSLIEVLSGKENGAERLKLELSKWLNPALHKTILSLAKEIMTEEHAFVIGKYLNYPAAQEFALKLKETSYIHAEAFAAGELKHGVITLVQKGTPCFILTDGSPAFKEIRSSAAELKARGGFIIGIGPENAPEFDRWIKTPDTGPEHAVFYNVIAGQMLGYYLGVGRGADPDKPRNLAKSVTVK